MRRFILAAALAILSVSPAYAEAPDVKLALPQSGIVKVAFVVPPGTTLIDLAGPMQVLDQAQSPGTSGFQTFTVSETRSPIKAGNLTVTPDYTFADVPDADIIVVGASGSQTGGASGISQPYLDYFRQMAARGKLMLSVCTGVEKFAAAGLLDGLDATTHHDHIDRLQKKYPKVHFIRDRAWVHSAPMIYTAGGETSGMELALHIAELYFDHDVAVKTARYMEYRGPAWQQ